MSRPSPKIVTPPVVRESKRLLQGIAGYETFTPNGCAMVKIFKVEVYLSSVKKGTLALSAARADDLVRRKMFFHTL